MISEETEASFPIDSISAKWCARGQNRKNCSTWNNFLESHGTRQHMSPTATGVISKPRVLSSAARDLERGAHELTIRLARKCSTWNIFSERITRANNIRWLVAAA